MMRALLTLILCVGLGAVAGYTIAPYAPTHYQSQTDLYIAGDADIPTEMALIQSRGFLGSLPFDIIGLEANNTGQVISLTLAHADQANTAMTLAEAYQDYRTVLLPGQNSIMAADLPTQTAIPLQQAQQNWVKAQIALRDAQLRHAKAVTPIATPALPLAPSLQNQLKQQNLQWAQMQFKKTGRLDGLAHDELSPLYHSLVAELVQLNATLAGQRVTYGNQHPNIIRLKRQINTVNTALTREAKTILTRMQAQTPSSDMVGGTQPGVQPPSEDIVLPDLSQLQNNVLEAKAIYQSALSFHEAQISMEDSQPASKAVILNTGKTYATPVANAGCMAMIGAAIGAGLWGLLLLRCWGKSRVITNAESLESLSDLPVYSMVPKATDYKKDGLLDHILVNSNNALAESLRHIRTQMRLRHKGLESPRVVAVTSALPAEGKSTLAAMMATICAQCGDRVLIIDADLRRPALHKIFDTGQAKGVVDILTGRHDLADSIDKTHETGVHVLTARPAPSHALALIDSSKFWQVIREVRGDYDLVLIDTPSILNFSDALVLAGLSDLTLFITKWRGTHVKRLQQALTLLKGVKITPMATVLTQVKKRDHRKLGGYADYQKKS